MAHTRCKGFGWALLALAAITALRAPALGPHEVALLVNSNSTRSMTVANEYTRLRGIPLQNVVYLDLPPHPRAESDISVEDFRARIWTRTQQALTDRGVADHILAWVYSVDFPTTVSTPCRTSLQGMTLLRGRVPSTGEVDRASYASPLFRGPAREGAPQGASASLEQFAMALRTNYPLPSMALGQCEPNGMRVSEILQGLKEAARAEGIHPDGAVNFVLSEDVRSKCRAWQVREAATELGSLGVKALVTTGAPDRAASLIGLQCGAARIEDWTNVKLLPGSMAEHLTSYGGAFDTTDQSKCTAWLRAGAAGTSGTVTEPYALWSKFPHARFFVHYASGCTMLESFAQSLACPLQTLLLGDPLARPFAASRPLMLVERGADAQGRMTFLVTDDSGKAAGGGLQFLYLLDGVALPVSGFSPLVQLDAAALDEGWHELRAIGYTRGAVRVQSPALRSFRIQNTSHLAELRVPEAAPSKTAFTCTLDTTGAKPGSYQLWAGGRLLQVQTNGVFTVDPARIGQGAVVLQGIAVYADGKRFLSKQETIKIPPVD